MAIPALALVSCNKSDVPTPDEVRQSVTLGTWHISLFSKSGTVYYDFEDYDFTFASNGTVNAQKSGSNVNGTWSLWELDGETQLDLDMGSAAPFNLLDAYWNVTEATSTRVKTENDDSGPLSHLTFEKN